MHETRLRAVGGSVMLTIPKPILEVLELGVNSEVGLSISTGRLIVEPKPLRRRYTLDELMAQCDPDAPMTDEEREWLEAKPVGRELI